MILYNPTQVSSSYMASYLLSSIKACIRYFSSILSVAYSLSSSFCESSNLRNFRFSFFSSSRFLTYYDRLDTSSEYYYNFFLNCMSFSSISRSPFTSCYTYSLFSLYFFLIISFYKKIRYKYLIRFFKRVSSSKISSRSFSTN